MKPTDNFDYLQRASFNAASLTANLPTIAASDKSRRLLRICGMGRFDKTATPAAKGDERSPRLASEDALIGLYGARIPIAFLVASDPHGVAIHLGIWSAVEENATPEQLELRQKVMESVLHGAFPAVQFSTVNFAEIRLAPLSLSGIALGIPSVKPADPLDNSLQLDRLIRALIGAHWAVLVLATPVEESQTIAVLNGVIDEMKAVDRQIEAKLAPRPVFEPYNEMLKSALKSLTHAEAVGGWRTAVYLLGDAITYDRLAAAWRSIYSGDQSFPEPVRVWKTSGSAASDLALKWAMPAVAGDEGPGQYRHPFRFQTLLTSSQLAAYIHLPQIETLGFAITTVPSFGVERRASEDASKILLGRIIQRGTETRADYEVGLNDFKRHAFIAGITGAGKTNTIFHILRQASKSSLPFAVIEPAKNEYRAFINDPDLRGIVRVFTLGDEAISPFRLNPFEVVSWPKIPVGVHIDLLRSVFASSFGMWSPLPQILERCLHEVYRDRGWDITHNRNYRLDVRSEVADAFPTLRELAAKAEDVIQKLGYEQKIADDMRAALLTRINGLRAGAKGRMLDVQRSLPMDALLNAPTVFELQQLGDDDDKAFLMGLLLIRLYEYRRAGEESENLQHLLVIEEAHRLLTNTGPRRSQEEADPRGKAVETFANLLSEIRAYGQGVIVADQIPVKLASEIIKNTNLKIIHRVVAEEDRAVLAGATAMDQPQAGSLATLRVGEAAVFSEGDDEPILVSVKKQKGDSTPDNDQVREYMAFSKVASNKPPLEPLSADVDVSQSRISNMLDAARSITGEPIFQREFVRFVISITETDEAVTLLWAPLMARIESTRQREMDQQVFQRCVSMCASEWFATRRGAQAGWTYGDTAEVQDKLHRLLGTIIEGEDWTEGLHEFRDCMNRLHTRQFEPYRGCAKICNRAEVCLYRFAVSDLVSRARATQTGQFNAAYGVGKMPETWKLCRQMAFQLVDPVSVEKTGAETRIALCYAQHMLEDRFATEHDFILDGLLSEASK